MKFTAQFLDEVRAAVPVSEVVGARVKLKRAGREWKGLSPFNQEKTASFYANDSKQFWHDFSSGKHGDIFGFVMETEGCSFPEAVERLASKAGIALPESSPEAEERSLRRASLRELTAAAAAFFARKLKGPEGNAARGYLADRGIDPMVTEQFGLGYAPKSASALKAHLLAEGAALEDIAEAGLISLREGQTAYTDTFVDRLVFPILDLRGRPIAFGARAMREDQQPKYLNSPDTPIFQKGETLYNAAGARKAAYAGQPLRVVEGYTDVIAMVSAGQEATVATLGTAVTEAHLAQLWKWTIEPVFCLDGDAAGQRAAAKVIDLAVPRLGEGRSVQFVKFPEGLDPDELLRKDGAEGLAAVLDHPTPLAEALWARERDAGPLDTPERCAALQDRLRAFVGSIQDKGVRALYGQWFARAIAAHFRGQQVPGWQPGHTSRFGRLAWRDQDMPAAVQYEWWVKGIIPKRETIAVVGPTQTGKSFETFNLAMHIALGQDYRGCRTRQGLVVYCAMEGGKGFRDRLRGYRKYHNLPLEGVPFEVLTRRADLFGSETDVRELITEIRAIAAEYEHELALVVIDTYSAATPGLKENASEDISRVRKRILQIENDCNCGVLVVDHTNAVGDKARGHTSKTADIETQLDLSWVTRKDGKDHVQVKDDDGRDIRRITVRKQREQQAGQHWDFVLRAVEVRKDEDGDPVTTCVSIAPARPTEDVRELSTSSKAAGAQGRKGFKLNRGETMFFKALLKVLERKGTKPATGIDVPTSVQRVATWVDFKLAYVEQDPNDEGETAEGRKRYAARVKVALRRARETLKNYGVIGITQMPETLPGQPGEHVIWPSGKRVWGPDLEWPPAPKVVTSRQAPDSAPPLSDEDMEAFLGERTPDGEEPPA